MAHIIVLGAGIGGMPAAYELRAQLATTHRITVVNAVDYLVITTGPKLAFDEVPGSGPAAHTQSICTFDHAEQARGRYEEFIKDPGPAIVGAMPGASCFGPAYEFAFILNKDLQRRKLSPRLLGRGLPAGSGKANGCTWPRSATKSTSCTR